MTLKAFNGTFQLTEGSFQNPVPHQLGAAPFSVIFIDSSGESLDLQWRIDLTMPLSRIFVSAPLGGLANIDVRILAVDNSSQALLPLIP